MSDLYKDSKNFRDLIRDVKRTPLVLFIGAGVNANLIPTWSALLNELMDIVTDRIIAISGGDSNHKKELKDALSSKEEHSDYERATLAKVILGTQYPVYLRSILYKEVKKRKLLNSYFHHKENESRNNNDTRFLREVVKLCKSRRVKAIVSYNYDDILQEAINDEKENPRKAFNICGPKTKVALPDDALPIYYVHGYIPNEVRAPSRDSMIVLSLDEYFQNMLEPYSWQTTTQLHFLQNYVSLFIGTSLTDWNIMRMLSTAKKYSVLGSVYCIMKSIEYKNKKINRYIPNRVKATLLNDLGVKMIVTENNGYDSIYEAIRILRDKMSEYDKEQTICKI
jgi:hypothetical protein